MEKIEQQDYEDIDLMDYPYLGIGKKPQKRKIITDEELEKIIGG